LEHEAAVRGVFGRYFRHFDDVDDLTQETFLRCFAAETKSHIREPKAFLLRVAKNIAFSELKKKARTTTDYLEDSSLSDVLKDDRQAYADVHLDRKRKLAILTKVVAGLPEDCRQAFLMRKMEKLKYDQIALRLNVSLSTVHRMIARAILQCSAALREQGYDVTEFGSESPSKKTAAEPAVTSMTTLGEPKRK
jgi:RNA polymerase sigma-70 factor (ECF subfamily)